MISKELKAGNETEAMVWPVAAGDHTAVETLPPNAEKYDEYSR